MRIPLVLLGWFWGTTCLSAAVLEVPSWFPKARPLPPPEGKVIRVTTAEELFVAVERAEPGHTILLADGHYQQPRVLVLQQKNDTTIRSASGDPTKVILHGQGWDSNAKSDDIVHIGHCDGVTIADLTFADCRSYGIKVEAESPFAVILTLFANRLSLPLFDTAL
jgi:hypothetical protein